VDVGASFVADAEAAVLVEPADRALDDPSLPPEAGAVSGLGVRDDGADAPLAEPAAVAAGVVGAVAEQAVGSFAWAAALAADRRDRVDQREQLEDVGAVGGADRERKRGAASAGNRMVLGAAPTAVYRAWTGLLAPPTART